MSEQATQAPFFASFPTLLGVLFIGLKLAHVIDWPWLWVLSPLWIPIALFLLMLAVAVLIVFAVKAAER